MQDDGASAVALCAIETYLRPSADQSEQHRHLRQEHEIHQRTLGRADHPSTPTNATTAITTTATTASSASSPSSVEHCHQVKNSLPVGARRARWRGQVQPSPAYPTQGGSLVEADAAVTGGGVNQKESRPGAGKDNSSSRLQAQEVPGAVLAPKPGVCCGGAPVS